MEKINLYLGKAHKKILNMLIEGLFEKAGIDIPDKAHLVVTLKVGKPVNPTVLVVDKG